MNEDTADRMDDLSYGPLVRPYAITRGRIASTSFELSLVTLVVALRDHVDMVDGEPEHEQILRLCRSPVSVAEVAARTNLPLTVVRVLLYDLIAHNYVIFREPLPSTSSRDPRLLQAVLDGIRDI
jgi:hypothetical protein